jgi:hypothetical protein
MNCGPSIGKRLFAFSMCSPNTVIPASAMSELSQAVGKGTSDSELAIIV